jgi:protein involved in polysaccharide export with SLBB domain
MSASLVTTLYRSAVTTGLLASLVLLTACTPTWVEQPYQQPEGFATWVDTGPYEYQIEPGDDLSVSFPFHSELNHQAPVSPDGSFTVPMVGVLQAAGRSTAQLAQHVDKALIDKGIAANAHALVTVLKYNSRVYVGGEVGAPGEVMLRPGMDALQAITAARGLRDTARTTEIVLIRRAPDGRPMLRTVNINALTRRGDPTQAVALRPSDTIFVPQSSISEVNQWINQYINLALPFNKSINYNFTNDTNSSSNNNP